MKLSRPFFVLIFVVIAVSNFKNYYKPSTSSINNRVNIKDVHDISTLHKLGYDGSGVVVAIVDSDVDMSHPCLIGNVECALKQKLTYKNTDKKERGHGTHVAGIIAAKLDDEMLSFCDAGIASGATILVTSTHSSDGFEEMFERAQNSEAKIVNISMGPFTIKYDEPISKKEMQLYKDLTYAGKLIIKAAGNAGRNTSNSEYLDSLFRLAHDINSDPTNLGYMIIVMNAQRKESNIMLVPSSDRPGLLSPGAQYAISAIGEKICSTLPERKFGYMSGTSMAAPVVSGTAALLMQAHPKASIKEIGAALVLGAVPSSKSFRQTDLEYRRLNVSLGAGILHAGNAHRILLKLKHSVIGEKPPPRKSFLSAKEIAEHHEVDLLKQTRIFLNDEFLGEEVSDIKKWYKDLFEIDDMKKIVAWISTFAQVTNSTTSLVVRDLVNKDLAPQTIKIMASLSMDDQRRFLNYLNEIGFSLKELEYIYTLFTKDMTEENLSYIVNKLVDESVTPEVIRMIPYLFANHVKASNRLSLINALIEGGFTSRAIKAIAALLTDNMSGINRARIINALFDSNIMDEKDIIKLAQTLSVNKEKLYDKGMTGREISNFIVESIIN